MPRALQNAKQRDRLLPFFRRAGLACCLLWLGSHAREMDGECAAGVLPDFTRASLLVRAVVDFHAQLALGTARAQITKVTLVG